jgi:hypothetical protein
MYVVWILPNLSETHGIYPYATETGTWPDTTLTSSTFNVSALPGRSSSTVADTTVLTFYGSTFTFWYATGSDKGKFSYAVDGGGATTVDAYVAGSEQVVSVTPAKNLTEGWHTVTLTVVTKNASASANTVKFGGFCTSVHSPDPGSEYISIGQGETVQLLECWKRASIDRVLSGSPTLQFTPNAATISLGGTGAALVRLSR